MFLLWFKWRHFCHNIQLCCSSVFHQNHLLLNETLFFSVNLMQLSAAFSIWRTSWVSSAGVMHTLVNSQFNKVNSNQNSWCNCVSNILVTPSLSLMWQVLHMHHFWSAFLLLLLSYSKLDLILTFLFKHHVVNNLILTCIVFFFLWKVVQML